MDINAELLQAVLKIMKSQVTVTELLGDISEKLNSILEHGASKNDLQPLMTKDAMIPIVEGLQQMNTNNDLVAESIDSIIDAVNKNTEASENVIGKLGVMETRLSPRRTSSEDKALLEELKAVSSQL